MHEWGQPLFCNITSGNVEVEQALFAHAITRCYLHGHSLMSISYISQKLDDLEAVAIVSSKLMGFIKSNRRIYS